MPAANVKENLSAGGSQTATELATASSPQTRNRHRLSDWINPKGRKIKLDRRDVNRDRRTNENPGYKGPARRETIDQRENLKDRRIEC